MNGIDYILAVRRYEERRANAIADLVIIVLGLTIGLTLYGAWRLIGWIL